MVKKIMGVLGIFSFLLGAIFSINSFSGITGFVIVKEAGRNVSSILGIAFIVVGLILFNLETRVQEEISYEEYGKVIMNQLYENFPTKNKDTYRMERQEFEERKKESPSDARRYLKKRAEEISSNPDIERIDEIKEMLNPNKKRIVFVSDDCFERARKDSRIKENLGRYMDEVEKIRKNPGQRQQEIIGDFHVSPRGHTDVRVAWHKEEKDGREIIYIDDFLYEEETGKYVDNWNEGARTKEIIPRDYDFNSNYRPSSL